MNVVRDTEMGLLWGGGADGNFSEILIFNSCCNNILSASETWCKVWTEVYCSLLFLQVQFRQF